MSKLFILYTINKTKKHTMFLKTFSSGYNNGKNVDILREENINWKSCNILIIINLGKYLSSVYVIPITSDKRLYD